MGRHVDTSWYDTYLRSKSLEKAEGRRLTDPEVAGLLDMKPKTWSRVKAAGRFLDGLEPTIPREDILCGYAPLERLAKLWSTDSEIAQEHLKAVLSNQKKLSELEKLIRLHATPEAERAAPRQPRVSSGQSLFVQLERYFDTAQLHHFNSYGGRCLKRRGTLGSPGGYYLYNAKGELTCLVLCIRAGGWRDPATTARELYEHAESLRHVAPSIWFVSESENMVLRRMAELSLHWGGSPFDADGHWLFLSHFNDTGYLEVLFEDYFARLISQIQAGKGLIAKHELYCSVEALDGLSSPDFVPLRPVRALPRPKRKRQYSDIINNRITQAGMADNATSLEMRAVLELELGL